MKSVLILADSYGGQRVFKGITDVPLDKTYPYLFKAHFTNLQTEINTASFRKMTEIPALCNENKNFDLLIVQAGIVDCFPRALSQKLTQSQSFFAKSLRKIIRLKRSIFLRLFRNKPWTSPSEFKNSIISIIESAAGRPILFLNIAPVNEKQEKENPGAKESIVRYNQLLTFATEGQSTVHIIDVHKVLEPISNRKQMLHSTDSHINSNGNMLYFELLRDKMRAYLQ